MLGRMGLILASVTAVAGCCLDVSGISSMVNDGGGQTTGASTSGATTSSGSSGGSTSSGRLIVVTTVASDGVFGDADGTGGPNGTAKFSGPTGVAVDPEGNVYFADTGDNRIRKIDTAGNVTTLAGNGPDDTTAFYGPTGIAMDAHGSLYVADTNNFRIQKVDPSGNVTTVAGNGVRGYVDGSATTAEFNNPSGVAVDEGGNVYVADTTNNRIRKVDPSGNVTTVAGNGTKGHSDGTGGPNGTADFVQPGGVALDAKGNLLVAEEWDIREIDPDGNVTTVAGNGKAGYADGPASSVEFQDPSSIALDGEGNIYVVDWGLNNVREIDVSGNVTTVAGNGKAGYADGPGGPQGSAEFWNPIGVAVDAQGNILVGDVNNNRVRKISFEPTPSP